jgi:hypothetical protein
MVSNTLHMTEREVLAALERLRREAGKTPEYRELREDLPKDWPL